MSTPSLRNGDPDDPRPLGSDGRTLTSWKDIAAYLGTTVRTAQRWERERDLPVRRLPGPRGLVFAAIADLDRWRNSPPEDSAPPQEGELQEVGEVQAPESTAQTRHSRRGLAVAAVVVLVCVGAWMAASRGSLGWGQGTPVSIRVHESGFAVFDRHGGELWHREFPDTRLNLPSYSAFGKTLAIVQDLDGDGRPEVLFGLQPSKRQGTLICYAADGSERWRYTPGTNVRTRTGQFAPPFSVIDIVVGRVKPSGETLIVVLGNHHAFFPGEAVLMTANGEIRGRYWHSGHLHSVTFWDTDGDGVNEIVLGGLSNAHKAATLVVLDAHRFSGASNERDRTDYQILGFPIAVERERIIFPRTALGKARYGLGGVIGVEAEDQQLLIHVSELYMGPDPMPLMWVLDQRLRFRDVSASSGLAHTYEQVRREAGGGEDLKSALESLPSQLIYTSGKQ